VNPFAGAIRVYERYIYLPGTVYGLILLVGLGGIVLVLRRRGGEALLPWLSSVALIVVPAATAEFDWRYVLTAVPFGCLAAALAFGRDTSGQRWLARRGLAGRDLGTGVTVAGAVPGGTAGRPGGVAGSGLGDGAVEAGHNERDFAPDSS
jgi:hypothetical protein